MRKFIYLIINRKIRRFFLKLFHQYKYDVKFGRKASAKNTFFEGKNTLREGAFLANSKMGLGSYVSENTVLKSVNIGRYTCIGPNVRNYMGKHPSNTFVSIHPAFYSINKQAGFTFVKEQKFEEHSYADMENKYINVIGNDVWIGSNVLIMDGINIGDGAIVASGSVLVKNVEPYTIVGGVPAKPLKKRFNDNQIKYLLQQKWWNKSLSWLQNNYLIFENIDYFISSKETEIFK